MQQEPEFEARNRGNSNEWDSLPLVIAQLSIEGFRAAQRVEVGAMVVAIEYGVDAVERAPRDSLVRIAMLEELARVLDDLVRGSADLAGLDGDVASGFRNGTPP